MAAGVQLSPVPIQRFVDNNGVALVGGKLFTYIGGTTTKLATFTDSGGLTQQTNPIIMNSRGEPENNSGVSIGIWLTPGSNYKFVLAPSTDTDPPSNPIWTLDNFEVQTIPPAFVAPNVQVLTSGSGATYTTPLNGSTLPLSLEVWFVGGGGGGGGTGGAGGTGGTTTFNSVTAIGGTGGAATVTGTGGIGGTGGGGAATDRSAGNGAGGGQQTANGAGGGGGGSAYFGGGAAQTETAAGIVGATNTGGGASGATGTASAIGAGGGGGGESVYLFITPPASSYTYTVGGGGTAGSGSGAAGGSGKIVVKAVWQ